MSRLGYPQESHIAMIAEYACAMWRRDTSFGTAQATARGRADGGLRVRVGSRRWHTGSLRLGVDPDGPGAAVVGTRAAGQPKFPIMRPADSRHPGRSPGWKAVSPGRRPSLHVGSRSARSEATSPFDQPPPLEARLRARRADSDGPPPAPSALRGSAGPCRAGLFGPPAPRDADRSARPSDRVASGRARRG